MRPGDIKEDVIFDEAQILASGDSLMSRSTIAELLRLPINR